MDSLLMFGISFLIACVIAYVVFIRFFVKSDKKLQNLLAGILVFFPCLGVTYMMVAIVSIMIWGK